MMAIGRCVHPLTDLHHFLLKARWPVLLGILGATYLLLVFLFALLFYFGKGSVTNGGSFLDAYFFSVQTLSTIGYGTMAPASYYGHVLVTIEAFVGMVGMALMTGLIFAKFTQPRPGIVFSNNAVIANRDGTPRLMFRAGNSRGHDIVDASVRVTFVISDRTDEGEPIRRFQPMVVERPETGLLPLAWTIIHSIRETSPLYGLDREALARLSPEIIVVINGYDNSTGHAIHARRSYVADEIVWDMRFADMLATCSDGRIVADYRKLHELVPNHSA